MRAAILGVIISRLFISAVRFFGPNKQLLESLEAFCFRAKTAVVGVCSTFAFATETTVEELKNCSKNENTAKSTGFWLSVWKNWCVDKEITDEIENYEPAELNTLLEHFYAEVNNKKGEDYEPESL